MAEVTDATFERDVLDRSSQVPVVVDLWAEWCGPCRTLTPILEKVVGETDGKVVLVNRGPTRGDPLVTVRLDAGCSEVLTALADALAAPAGSPAPRTDRGRARTA